mmetsp:Transcript_95315/g.188960  ORF Transcript_95315/g.188960 Transcript_95315/m.188960 type:complete len:89 (+) Transcript_95315:127-393(+)
MREHERYTPSKLGVLHCVQGSRRPGDKGTSDERDRINRRFPPPLLPDSAVKKKRQKERHHRPRHRPFVVVVTKVQGLGHTATRSVPLP